MINKSENEVNMQDGGTWLTAYSNLPNGKVYD